MSLKIGVIGDYDGRLSHLATDEAIKHCCSNLGINQETKWISTDSLISNSEQKLRGFDAFWCAPGSPYKSAQGAMNAIRFAREEDFPFIGTCGGFQHAVLEAARDILGLTELSKADFDPYETNIFISSLSCSLVGETKTIIIANGTKTAKIYRRPKTAERYNCNFGVNSSFLEKLVAVGFFITGTDEVDGDARILELPQNKFFIATLFQPQLTSTPENPHKLVLAFLKSAMDARNSADKNA